MVKGGHGCDVTRYGDTINEWAVRILLECILGSKCFSDKNIDSLNVLNKSYIRV